LICVLYTGEFSSSESTGSIYAHILIDEMAFLSVVSEKRLARWTPDPFRIDQNGRFTVVQPVSIAMSIKNDDEESVFSVS
jgi:hypothetical protein